MCLQYGLNTLQLYSLFNRQSVSGEMRMIMMQLVTDVGECLSVADFTALCIWFDCTTLSVSDSFVT